MCSVIKVFKYFLNIGTKITPKVLLSDPPSLKSIINIWWKFHLTRQFLNFQRAEQLWWYTVKMTSSSKSMIAHKMKPDPQLFNISAHSFCLGSNTTCRVFFLTNVLLFWKCLLLLFLFKSPIFENGEYEVTCECDKWPITVRDIALLLS